MEISDKELRELFNKLSDNEKLNILAQMAEILNARKVWQTVKASV